MTDSKAKFFSSHEPVTPNTVIPIPKGRNEKRKGDGSQVNPNLTRQIPLDLKVPE